jgi:4a-hydroxytetrahydrobiopterin dehydratase
MAILDDATVDRALASAPWRREQKEIIRVVKRSDFADALAFVNAVGRLAEEADHHPDIDIRWDTVTLRLSTHSEGGITKADLALAQAIDELG